MRKLIKKILRESDEWDWARNIQPPTFKNAIKGQEYNIIVTPVLMDALNACDENDLEEKYNAKRVRVVRKDHMSYNDVFCDHEKSDEVPVLLLEFLDSDGVKIGRMFWVTEDMVQLY